MFCKTVFLDLTRAFYTVMTDQILLSRLPKDELSITNYVIFHTDDALFRSAQYGSRGHSRPIYTMKKVERIGKNRTTKKSPFTQ